MAGAPCKSVQKVSSSASGEQESLEIVPICGTTRRTPMIPIHQRSDFGRLAKQVAGHGQRFPASKSLTRRVNGNRRVGYSSWTTDALIGREHCKGKLAGRIVALKDGWTRRRNSQCELPQQVDTCESVGVPRSSRYSIDSWTHRVKTIYGRFSNYFPRQQLSSVASRLT